MAGLLSAEAARGFDHSAAFGLAKASSGFWGVDNEGIAHPMCGIRRGHGGKEAAPDEARLVAAPGTGRKYVIASGDRVGMLVDMDARTLTMLRNGTPIPSLVIDGLPEQVYVATTLGTDKYTARIVRE